MKHATCIVALLLAPILTLSGCSSLRPTVPIASLPPAEMPRYAPGDLFVFEGGYVERVVDTQDDSILWEIAGGRLRFSTPKDILLPRKTWETAEERGDLAYAADPKSGLWPLIPGKKSVTFVESLYTDKVHSWSKQYPFDWWCKVLDPVRVDTPLGAFDTFPVKCNRQSGTMSQQTFHTRIVYYAPSLGHYVRKVDEYAPTKLTPYRFVQRDLLSVIRPLGNATREERAASEIHFQNSMETLKNGEQAAWRSTDDRFGRSIQIVKTYLTEDGRYCRDFLSTTQDRGRTSSHTGSACREKNHWRYAILFDNPDAPPVQTTR